MNANLSEYVLPSAARAAMTASWRKSVVRLLQLHPERVHLLMTAPRSEWAASALDFGGHFDLYLALTDAQSPEEKVVGQVAFCWLQHRFSERRAAPERHTELKVSTLSEMLYIDVERARFQRWLDTDPQRPLAIDGIGSSRLICTTRQLCEALSALDDAAPQLRGEIAITSPKVVLMRSDEGASRLFDSGSSFCLWVCITLNGDTNSNSWNCFCRSVHDSAHSLLFVFAREQPLALNLTEQRLNSPLPAKQRPRDNVLHAAYGSALERWALRRALAHAARLPDGDLDSRRTACRSGFERAKQLVGFAMSRIRAWPNSAHSVHASCRNRVTMFYLPPPMTASARPLIGSQPRY